MKGNCHSAKREAAAYGSRIALAEPVIGRRFAPTRWLTCPGRRRLNPPPRPLPIGIAQAALENLAGILARQVFEDFDVFRHFIVGQRGLQPRPYVSDIQRHPCLRFYHRHQRLAEFLVGDAEYRAVVDAGNRMQRGLDFGRVDVDAARNHHVALAIADEDVAVRVDVADVARGDKTVALDLGALLRLVVIGEIRIIRYPRIDLADLALRQHPAILADEAQFRARRYLADGAGLLQRVLGIGEGHRAGFGRAVEFIDHRPPPFDHRALDVGGTGCG